MNDGLCSYCELNGNDDSVCSYEKSRTSVLKSGKRINGVYFARWKENDGRVLLCGGFVGDYKIRQYFLKELEEIISYAYRKLRLYEWYLNVTSSPQLPSQSIS